MRKAGQLFVLIMLQLLLYCWPLFSGETVIEAGENCFLNWERSHSLTLRGKVSPQDLEVQWSCPQHADVIFERADRPVTRVTFPRPGYFLLILAKKGSDAAEERDSLIVNVVKRGSYEERLSDLIDLMTVQEKINQLTNIADTIPRLGLPAYNYWNEALHGVLAGGATSFPQAIAMGATWDPDLVQRVASAISDEARALHKKEGKGLTYWSPTINIARDPRWGRNEESYSEDPYLLSRFAVAFVRGMQGDDPYYLKTVATPKHFVANNEEERRHTGSADVDMRNLFEYYLPAFRAAITEAKAYSIMGAYNELNHVPCNANTYLLTDLLRRRWGFCGYVVTDCGAINDMLFGHKFFNSGAEAVARTLLAGCDLNCGLAFREYLQEALDSGLIEEKDIDRALSRVLSARFRLGEFDPPEMVPYTSISEEELDCEEHRQLALKAAHKAMVLLKNDGILPLAKDKIRSIAVIGPNAAELQLGIYSGFPNIMVSPLEGIRKKAEESGIEVHYTKGSSIGGGLLHPIEAQYFGQVQGSDRTGMLGEYYDNMSLSGEPVLTRIDSTIDFSFGSMGPASELPRDQFSVRWRGTIIPPDTIYHLGTSCDDGSRLYLDGKLLFEDWIEHGEKPVSVEVKLLPGREYEVIFEYFESRLGACARLTWDLGEKDFHKAQEVAAACDAVVLVLGTTPGLSQEELDRKTIELPKVQRDLLQAVAEVNPNIILVLINGGPLALVGSENKARAILEAWYPGELGGLAIADVLFGEVNPGGKLPQTFYASTDQLPPMWDYDIINNPRTYLYFDGPVLFPFGHGLSYTQFEYEDLKLSSRTIGPADTLQIRFTVKNIGSLTGDEVAQVYVRALPGHKDASFKIPLKQLKRFQRMTLKPGEKNELVFHIPAFEFSFYSTRSNDFEVFRGQWEIQVGSSSQDIRLSAKMTIQ